MLDGEKRASANAESTYCGTPLAMTSRIAKEGTCRARKSLNMENSSSIFLLLWEERVAAGTRYKFGVAKVCHLQLFSDCRYNAACAWPGKSSLLFEQFHLAGSHQCSRDVKFISGQ